MTENKKTENSVRVCAYLRSIASVLTSCFPMGKGKTISMAEQDKLQHLESEWKELYKRVDNLENTSGKVNSNNSEINNNQSQNKCVQTYITEEVKELFTRIDNLEKRLDHFSVIQQSNLDIMKRLDNKLKRMDEGSWYSVDMNNHSLSSNCSHKSDSSDEPRLLESDDDDKISHDSNDSNDSNNLDVKSLDNLEIDNESFEMDIDSNETPER